MPVSGKARKPVFMMLTSEAHPLDVFNLSLKSFVRSTDLSLFEAVYFCCNAVSQERIALISRVCRNNPNVHALHCGPAGHHPCVPYFINSVIATHPESAIIKADDDMFFTPGWADKVIEHYNETLDDPDLAIIAPLIPINTQGLQCLFTYLNDTYGERFREGLIRSLAINRNIKTQSLLWEGVMRDYLIEKFITRLADPIWEFGGPDSHISINCVLFDKRLHQHFAPLPLFEAWYLDGNKLFDENAMIRAMHEHDLKGHVVQDAVVHHYCFNQSKEQIRELFPLHEVYEFILNAKGVDCPARKRLKQVA